MANYGKKKPGTKFGQKAGTKTGSKPQKPAVLMPGGWYLMSAHELGVQEIRQVLDEDHADLHIWEEAGVIEVILGEKSSLDIEEVSVDFRDDFSREFVEKNGIVAGYYLTIKPEDYAKVEATFQKLAERLDVMICGDTEDFGPVIK